MNNSDHERCSELLTRHVRGELGAEEQGWVEEHLATCSDCRAEQGALRSLVAGEVDPLTEIERARLRRAVLGSVQSTQAGSETGSDLTTGAEPLQSGAEPTAIAGGRAFQLLGAAALVLIAAVFMFSSGLLGGGDAGLEESAGGDAGVTKEAPAGVEDETLDSDGGGASAAMEAGPPAPEPTFRRSLGSITGKRLQKLGREGLPLVIFSRAYSTEQVPELQTEFRDRLASAAGAKSDIVRQCSDLVTSAFPNSLPAYGALATLEKLNGREVLVLAFAWTDASSGPLDQSMVWAWPSDNCDQPVEYFKNVIQPEQ